MIAKIPRRESCRSVDPVLLTWLNSFRLAIDLGQSEYKAGSLLRELNPSMFFPASPKFRFDPAMPHRGYMYSDIVLFVSVQPYVPNALN